MPDEPANPVPVFFARRLCKTYGSVKSRCTLCATSISISTKANLSFCSDRRFGQIYASQYLSLRVLGFTRSEVGRILFGEFTVEVLLDIPLGALLSQVIVGVIARFHSNESFQIPPIIEPRTYLSAAGIVIAAALVNAFVVRRRIDRLDLVSVLKTRD
jgi:hypothetical protein